MPLHCLPCTSLTPLHLATSSTACLPGPSLPRLLPHTATATVPACHARLLPSWTCCPGSLTACIHCLCLPPYLSHLHLSSPFCLPVSCHSYCNLASLPYPGPACHTCLPCLPALPCLHLPACLPAPACAPATTCLPHLPLRTTTMSPATACTACRLPPPACLLLPACHLHLPLPGHLCLQTLPAWILCLPGLPSSACSHACLCLPGRSSTAWSSTCLLPATSFNTLYMPCLPAPPPATRIASSLVARSASRLALRLPPPPPPACQHCYAALVLPRILATASPSHHATCCQQHAAASFSTSITFAQTPALPPPADTSSASCCCLGHLVHGSACTLPAGPAGAL